MTNKDLNAMRLEAAQHSRGISSQPIYSAVLRALSAAGASGTILDFGAGAGNLSRLLCERTQFAKVGAIDIAQFSSDAPHEKLEWTYCDLNSTVPLPDGCFDVIVSSEVIEHLENPRFVTREWFRLLRPGGVLVFSTPNNESWRSMVSLAARGHFAHFTGDSYPAHITALLRLDMRRILTEAGFTAVEFSFTNHGAIPGMTRWTWQKVSGGFLKGLRYSDNLVCTATKPVR